MAGVGGQQPASMLPPTVQQPGPDHRLGGLQPAIAAQRPGRFRRQPFYLGGLLFRERGEEPPFSPSGAGAPAFRLTGRASQIFSFTSTICSVSAANSACRATSRRTFSTSAAASCRPVVFRRPADRVHRNRGP